jgi:TRAP transporter TAXI family solute receptor
MGQVFGQTYILSGPEKGSYHQFGDDIVGLFGDNDGLLINQATDGSAKNFEVLTDPNSIYKIALIQSDFLELMKTEDKLNNTNKTGSLKVVMPLATEQIHLVSKKSSGMTSILDLGKRRVGIGNKEQGGFATSRIIRERSKIDYRTVYVGFDEMLSYLSDGRIDATLVVGSAPLSMLNIDPQVMIDELTLLDLDNHNGWADHYENDTIFGGDYKWLQKDMPTFGVRTLLVVNEAKMKAADKELVGQIKSNIVQNLDLLKEKGHPKWRTVKVPE